MRSVRCGIAFALMLFVASAAWALGPDAKAAKKPKAAAGDDAKEIQGTWKAIPVVRDGNPARQPDLTLIIGGGRITAIVDGKAEETGRYRLDPTASPKTIDLLEPNADVGRGIYSLSGDEMRMCIAGKSGAARPTDLESKPGSGNMSIVLKRQSRDWKHPAAAKPDVKEKAAAESNALKPVKVSGTVKYKDGTLIPVPEKGKGGPPIVIFTPAGGAIAGQFHKGAGARIKADGTFELTTVKPGDGVIPGRYIVTVYSPATDPPDGTSLVPKKYANSKTSGLEITIDKPTSDLRIELDKP